MACRHQCSEAAASLFFLWAIIPCPICTGLQLANDWSKPSVESLLSLRRSRENTENANCAGHRSKWHGPNMSTPEFETKLRSWMGFQTPGGFSPLLAKPKPAFLMMSFKRIVFAKAWENVFKQQDTETFSLVVHVKNREKEEELPKFFRPYVLPDDVPTDRCHDTQLMIKMMSFALQDEHVTHVAFISGDTLPLKPLSFIIQDLKNDGRSRLCADTEWQRAETWIVLERKHATLFVEHENDLRELIPYSDCEDEDVFYWPLAVRQESINDQCAMMTDWSDTNKFWNTKTEKCACPKFLWGSDKRPAKCSTPALFLNVRGPGLNELISSSANYWYARKFAGDGVEGTTTYEGSASLDEEMAKRLNSSMH